MYWEPSAENTKKLHAAAAAFNEIWKTGDASIADKILDKDVTDYNLMFGGEPKTGAEEFKKMITGVFKVRAVILWTLWLYFLSQRSTRLLYCTFAY